MIAVVVVAFIYFFFLVPLYIRYRYKKVVEKFCRDEKNKNIFLSSKLVINDSGILSKDEAAETMYRWNAFVRQSFHRGYTYLYLSNVQAVIIPDRVFANKNEKEEFLRIVSSNLPSKAGSPAPEEHGVK